MDMPADRSKFWPNRSILIHQWPQEHGIENGSSYPTPIPPPHTHPLGPTEPAGGASRILRQSSPYLGVDSPPVFAFGGRGGSGDSEGLPSEPPSIIGVSTPSLLAAEAAAAAAAAGEGGDYGGEEDEEEGEVTDETPFLREQRRRTRRRPLPQR